MYGNLFRKLSGYESLRQSYSKSIMATLTELCAGLPLDPLPPLRPRDASLSHAPVRTPQLSGDEKKVCMIKSSFMQDWT